MVKDFVPPNQEGGRAKSRLRPLRADAQRSEDALLHAALSIFATLGVDAPVREIAEKAGVGIATLYRRFPLRSDLVVAVFRQQVDACADAAPVLAQQHAPAEALVRWMQRYAEFIATKRGLAAALNSGDPAYSTLHAYFDQRLQPAVRTLLEAASATGEIRADIVPYDLLRAVSSLCMSAGADQTDYAQRMVSLLIDGLRFRAST